MILTAISYLVSYARWLRGPPAVRFHGRTEAGEPVKNYCASVAFNDAQVTAMVQVLEKQFSSYEIRFVQVSRQENSDFLTMYMSQASSFDQVQHSDNPSKVQLGERPLLIEKLFKESYIEHVPPMHDLSPYNWKQEQRWRTSAYEMYVGLFPKSFPVAGSAGFTRWVVKERKPDEQELWKRETLQKLRLFGLDTLNDEEARFTEPECAVINEEVVVTDKLWLRIANEELEFSSGSATVLWTILPSYKARRTDGSEVELTIQLRKVEQWEMRISGRDLDNTEYSRVIRFEPVTV